MSAQFESQPLWYGTLDARTRRGARFLTTFAGLPDAGTGRGLRCLYDDFNAQISGDHTMNPSQREFIKLAQIMKSRLITEIELKQRVVERALIETRVGNYEEQLKLALFKEEQSQIQLADQQRNLQQQITHTMEIVPQIAAGLQEFLDENKNATDTEVDRLAGKIVPRSIRDGSGYLKISDSGTWLFHTSPLPGSSYQNVPEAVKAVYKSRITKVSTEANDAAWNGDIEGFYAKFIESVRLQQQVALQSDTQCRTRKTCSV